MREEIVDLIIKELLLHIEEIKRLEIGDRISYLGFLIEDISGIPAVYLPKEAAKRIIEALEKEVRLNKSTIS